MDVATLVLGVDSRGVTDATRAMDGMTTVGRGLEGVVQKLAAAWASWKIVQYAKEAATLAARYDTLGVVMGVVGNNAGYTRAQMDAYAASLTRSGISMVESRESLSVMAQSHIDLAKATQLGRLAQNAAVVGNMNSSEAFQNMIHGIQSGQTEILRTIGINVNFENSYKTLADSLHKTVAQLTEQEKTQARTNAVLAKAKDLNGAYEASMETAGKQLLSMTRYAEDFQTVAGALLSDAFSVGVQAINGGLQSMKKWLVDNAEAARTMNAMLGSAAGNFVGLVKDVLGLASSMTKFDDELSIGEILAGGLALTMAVIRDTVMALVGLVQTLWGGIEVVISGTLLGVSKVLNTLVGFQPPEWLTTLWNHGQETTSAGVKNMTTSATAALYNPGGDSVETVRAEQAAANKAKAQEQARIAAGNQTRADEAAASAAKIRSDAVKALSDAIQKENETLDRERILLDRGASAAFAYDLAQKGITGTAKVMLETKRDQVEAEKALTKQMADSSARDQAEGVALNEIMDQAVQHYQSIGQSAEESMQMKLKDAGATQEQIAATMAWVSASKAKQDALDQEAEAKKTSADLDKEAAKMNIRNNTTTGQEHLDVLAAHGLNADVYREQSRKLLLESQTTWGAIAYTIENSADRGASALADFFNTGKNGFRDMVSSILVDMEKLILKQQLLSPILSGASGWLSGLFGPKTYANGNVTGGDSFGTWGSGIGGTYVPSYAVGTDYVPKTGLALIHQGERITPAAQNRAGSSSGSQVNSSIVVNVSPNGQVDSKTAASSGVDMASKIHSVVLETIQKEQRPGGVLNPV